MYKKTFGEPGTQNGCLCAVLVAGPEAFGGQGLVDTCVLGRRVLAAGLESQI